MSSVSLEKGSKTPPQPFQGYRRLSSFLAQDRDRSTSVYRGFRRVTTRNLLYLESELAELEARQDAMDDSDSQDMDGLASAASWEVLSKSTRGVDQERMDLIREIRRIAQEYR
jgi:hypothetical protein